MSESMQIAPPVMIQDQLDIIDSKFAEAESLFTKIYNEFIGSDIFQQWVAVSKKWEKTKTCKKDPYDNFPKSAMIISIHYMGVEEEDSLLYKEYRKILIKVGKTSFARRKYNMKMGLLLAYLGLKETDTVFPLEWYHSEYMQPW